jgi:DNA replication protein DnaC
MSFCLAGTHGCGKTMAVTNILKKAAHKNFTALYTTLGDIVSALTLASSEDKFSARKELTEVDFLVIDELDPRFIGSENAADLFGRTFEHILRTRLQNKLPTIIVSNSPNPVESFSGSIKQSLESLMTKLPLVPILGKDVRKELAMVSGEQRNEQGFILA